MPAVDYYLKLDGVDGESTAAQLPGWIDLESFSWGITNTSTISSSGGGAGAGKAIQVPLVIVKRVDKATPKLFLGVAMGTIIPEAILIGRKSSSKTTYLEYKLTDVLISSVKDAGNEGEEPLEEVTLLFGKVEISYLPLLPNGQAGQPVRSSWNFIRNAPN